MNPNRYRSCPAKAKTAVMKPKKYKRCPAFVRRSKLVTNVRRYNSKLVTKAKTYAAIAA
jgi:hypothetical protein